MANARAAAAEYAQLFPAVYLRFHRRDGAGRTLGNAARGVLMHLELSGPLTIGEAAKHFGRAQSVVSEIVESLQKKGLVERFRDPRDRRRTLVWLSEGGLRELAEAREVLSKELLERVFERLTPSARRTLLHATRALVTAADELANEHASPTPTPGPTPAKAQPRKRNPRE